MLSRYINDERIEMDKVNYIIKTSEQTPANYTENKREESFKTTKKKNCRLLKVWFGFFVY